MKGDLVLVKMLAFEGKHKISDRWEDNPYIVIDQPNLDILVYVVKQQDGEGRKRTLHRNQLLPVGHMEPGRPTPKPRTKKQQLKPPEKVKEEFMPASSDDEMEILVYQTENDSDSSITRNDQHQEIPTVSRSEIGSDRDAHTTENQNTRRPSTPE